MKNNLDIIIPISMDGDWPTKEELIRDILEQYEQYGFTRFALTSPCAGWRSVGYPPKEFFFETAQLFKEIKEELAPYGIECGWWNTLTIKSGKTPGFQSIVKADGSEHPFANCPLCQAFKTRFVADVADFAAIAKPAFIMTEDDFSLSAAAGCYCDLHIAEFNRRYGFGFSREELVDVLSKRTPEALEIIKKWRELAKNSQVELAAAMRKALDIESPEIPMGYLQAGLADDDGDCTYEIARAMAGQNHKPFSRLFGAAYGGIVSREIPMLLFHMLYSKQHLPSDFLCYMEADTFPHIRFFSAGCQMMATMAVVFSYGFEGALFIDRQILDGANEETAYGYAFSKERKRFEAIAETTKECCVKGVEIRYDPLWNTLDSSRRPTPVWTQPLGRFGIPYTTTESDVLFLDDRQAAYMGDAEVKKALSKVLFIDSMAAKTLCDRGYGEFLGVDIGENIQFEDNLQWDLSAREIITDDYASSLRGRNMTAPWMLAAKGNGILPRINITDSRCRTITEFYNFKKELITPAMTLFENELGGKVIVMGLTLNRNGSQALFNYRRKHILQKLIIDCCDNYCLVKNAPDVMIVENEATNESTDFKEILTLVNMCEDPLEEVNLHLPKTLCNLTNIQMLDIYGEWQNVSYTNTEDGVIVHHPLGYCQPLYLKLK